MTRMKITGHWFDQLLNVVFRCFKCRLIPEIGSSLIHFIKTVATNEQIIDQMLFLWPEWFENKVFYFTLMTKECTNVSPKCQTLSVSTTSHDIIK